MSSGPNKAWCKLCGNFFKHDAKNTLKNHHGYKYCKVLKNKAPRDQAMMKNDASIFAYTLMRFGNKMAQFVIRQSLPLNYFDNPRLTRLIQQTREYRYTHTGVSLTCDV
ncbi:hypothetical protein R6Q57_018716 [Mikania cordata]